MRSIVQVAQSNDFHLVLTAILRSEWSPFIIRVAPRNTEAITSNPRKAARSNKSSRRREEPELKYTCGEAGETKSEITSKADTKSENEAKGVTSEWLKVSQTCKPQVVTIS